MNTIIHQENRWKIIYGEYEQQEKYAVNMVYEAVSPYVTYTLIAEKAMIQKDLSDFNIIMIGTNKSNPYIANFVKDELISLPDNSEGYSLLVCKSPFHPERQMIVIAGEDRQGVLYGACDFAGEYLGRIRYNYDHHKYYVRKLFVEPFPEYKKISSPKIKNRGIWTWGHVVYNYERFIDQMVCLKLNMLVIWNDHVPVNSKDIIEYAHQRGIKIIWGFSWGWGEKIDISQKENYRKWAQKVLDVYERDYADLGGDGIYFQTFTETEEESQNQILIAEAVVEWVNYIGNKMLSAYPDLQIQFGLHATSVKNHLDYLKKIDRRIEILWEDAGAFPYAYEPHRVESFEETLNFHRTVSCLRGKEDKFGAVLKGCICLNWNNFEHQMGNYILGCNRKRVKEKTQCQREIWKYIQAYWLINAHYAKDLIYETAELKNGNATLQILVEDGMLEEKLWYPVVIYSKLLWNPDDDVEEIICHAALEQNVYFA